MNNNNKRKRPQQHRCNCKRSGMGRDLNLGRYVSYRLEKKKLADIGCGPGPISRPIFAHIGRISVDIYIFFIFYFKKQLFIF